MKRVDLGIQQRLNAAATFEPDDSHLSGTAVRPLFYFRDCPRERKMHIHVSIAAQRDRLVRMKRTRSGSLKTNRPEILGKNVEKKVTGPARWLQWIPFWAAGERNAAWESPA